MNINDLVLENIEKYGVKIFQYPTYFKFGVDAFCLANFTKEFIHNKEVYIDFCSGTGIVGILTSKFNNILKPHFIELNEYFAEINKINLDINGIEGDVINDDIKNSEKYFGQESVDFITINPPYMKKNHGLNTRNEYKDIAKIENDSEFLNIIFSKSHRLLKDQGQLFMVHRVERLVDIFVSARSNKMEAKTIQYIRNVGSKKASLVLIRFVKNGKEFLNNLDDYII